MTTTIEVPLGAAVAAGAALLLALIGLVLMARSRRHHARRLADAAVRLEAAPVLDTKGGFDRLIGFVEAGTDAAIAARTEALARGDRFAQALDAVPQGVLLCDEHGTVVWRNRVAEQFAGGRHSDAVLAGAVADLLERARAEGPQQQTLDLFGPPRRQLVISAVPLEQGWRAGGAVAVVDDVSERRRVESMRRDFVANISHELKTPVGALALLAETTAGEPDAKVVRRLADRMQHEAQRVGRIIDDLLELSKVESEEAPQREPVAVHLVVAEAVERVWSLAERERVALDVPEPDAGLAVVGDRRQLVSALFNLLENAVKYSDAGATVAIEVSATPAGLIEIAVRDQGVGIPARDLERIFERFYRVDRGRSRDTGGTGLGLAIVRHVARNHGGEVRVQSREGEGSRFALSLPAAPTGVRGADALRAGQWQ